VSVTEDPLAAQEAVLESRPRRDVRSTADKAAAVLLPLAALVSLIALWHVATIIFGWEVFVVPTPGDVLQALRDERDILPEHTLTTLLETLEGYGLAIVVGVPLAVFIAYSKTFERMVYPLLLAINAIPKIAIAPILVIWMGFGLGPKIVMVFLVCFFPIVLSTATGLQSTPPEFTELIRSLSASPLQMFLKVRFPAALPHVFVGLKVAISLAVIGAVIAEFVGSSEGLGYVIIASGNNANTSLAFAAMVLLSVMSIVLFYALVIIERILVPWARYDQRS
jgi:NitT/TauT family transport system permease protein